MTAETSSGARDAESTARVRGVDCVRAWATARDAAEELYEALAKLGLGPEDIRLTPHADGEGRGWCASMARRKGFASWRKP